ncbi:terpene synthase family protein [Lentzea albida]|uniref:terpene synthase family protein n=1 Tax=Lentzea albida TaxID=65499 RepID=UPI00116012F6|nr:terpene synthase family protein [Lentzea albida]
MAELYFPFPVHADIGHDEYDREAAEWLSLHCELAPDRLEAVSGSRVAAMFAFSAASALSERIEVLTRWSLVNFLIDDVIEAAPIEQATVIASVCRRIWDNPASSVPDMPIVAALRQNTSTLLTMATPVQRQRLRAAHQEYFSSLVAQHLVDAAPQPPSVEVHTFIREMTSGMPGFSAVAEFVTGMDIPEDEYHSPQVRAFAQAVHLAVGWVNDVCAYTKDIREGHQNNVVAVLAARSGSDTRKAFDDAVAIINKAYYVVDELSHVLLREGSPGLCGYVRLLLRKQGAFVPWHLNSPRYADTTVGESLTITTTAPPDVHVPPDISSIAWWWDHLPVRDAA